MPTAPGAAPSSASATDAPAATASATPPACSLFPPANVWRARVTGLPAHPDSADYVASIGARAPLRLGFGATSGVRVTTVDADQPDVPVTFRRSAESDAGPYPLPPSAGGDLVVVYSPSRCRLYELSDARRQAGGAWHAETGAIFDLAANSLRPAGWASADDAGLPVLPGLVRYDETVGGAITHPIRITVPRTRTGYVWPARHSSSRVKDRRLPQLGLRLRLRATVDTTDLPPAARAIAEAMRRYGVIVAGEGPAWELAGEADSRWQNADLTPLTRLTGADFEAVDTAPLRAAPDSALVRG
ncbi:hypothetical protein [Rhizomonospora bruguierae]|uniref:hypothetical protein n=1 Tax=Rhizomonospora bruguierae TaxID=1581705 RepID=UPI001BCB8DFB|nr:hypothetical protein [Micromonospora sp. NBRC 107566]